MASRSCPCEKKIVMKITTLVMRVVLMVVIMTMARRVMTMVKTLRVKTWQRNRS